MIRLDRDTSNPKDYLDISKLEELKSYTKVAFVHDAYASIDKIGRGYITLVLKDCHSNLIYARLFDVEDFESCGIKIDSLKRKPILLAFKTQIWNNSYSLVIQNVNGIKKYDGEFDFDSFVGRFEVDDSNIECYGFDIYSEVWKVPYKWKTTSLATIGQGRINAFTYLFHSALSVLTSSLTIQEHLLNQVLRCYYESMQVYFNYLESNDKFDMYGELKIFRYLTDIQSKSFSESDKVIITDIVTSLCGMRKPKHLYAHLIVNAVKGAEHTLDLLLTNQTMTLGSSWNCGGDVLSKY